MATHSPNPDQTGLRYWMLEVLRQCELASAGFEEDPVHDLRVALRRCRSLADGLRCFDPSPEWRRMKRAGKPLFAALGKLRDVQVMAGWVKKLFEPEDPAAQTLLRHCEAEIAATTQEAAADLAAFDRKQWQEWAETLPGRAAVLPLDSDLFRHLALERWQEARELHRLALRNRTKVGFHNLRIGVKRLRYTIENFLPKMYATCGKQLKDVQDQLGEIHDFDVLWSTALAIKAFPDAPSHDLWRDRITEVRGQRLARYHESMVGRESLWQEWRALLPAEGELAELGLQRMKIWAAFLDPDASHSELVARLALQLYDGLAGDGFIRRNRRYSNRTILQAAALLHEVGRSRRERDHHKLAYRMVSRLKPPLGWNPEEVRMAGVIARYHRGALPLAEHTGFSSLSASRQRTAVALAGILRLADSLDRDHKGEVRGLQVEDHGDFVILWCDGYDPARNGLRVASARHLLETVWGRPVMVRPLVERTA